MADTPIRAHTIATTTHGRYLVRPPDGSVEADSAPPGSAGAARGARVPVLVAFHGYGTDAESMIDALARIPAARRWLCVAVQGLHRFYNRSQGTVVASWMTHQDRELAIADNIRYVQSVLEAMARDWTFERLVYVGFSQGTAMAWRAAAYAGRPADGVIALAGDLPPEIRDDPSASLPPALLGRGWDDPWYKEEKLVADVAALAARGTPHEQVIFDGGHEWGEPFFAAADTFLSNLVAASTPDIVEARRRG